ncbi:MAG TPA: LemA family protein [Patescibacteria group bacterium]|nr:LemA family protein [Patescibacteria group bacterium]
MNTGVILIGVIVISALYVWATYNGLVTIKARIKEALSGIDVQLKRRTDLIPNLIETVKGYASHEKGVLENVTKARASLLSAQSPIDKAEANNMLSGALKSLFAVAESYPQLKASENFSQLQRQLEDTEDKIAFSRQFYNSNVLEYNTKIKVFPNHILANIFNFSEEVFFEASEEERKKVDVKFD